MVFSFPMYNLILSRKFLLNNRPISMPLKDNNIIKNIFLNCLILSIKINHIYEIVENIMYKLYIILNGYSKFITSV